MTTTGVNLIPASRRQAKQLQVRVRWWLVACVVYAVLWIAGFVAAQVVVGSEDRAVRGKFKAKPGAQFMIRKEIYNRVHKAFAEGGIHFAHRRVAIDLPEGIDAKSAQGKVLSEAAAAAIAAEDAGPALGQPKPA